MQNIGEEIAGEYLKFVKGCEFIEYNLYTPDVQGEIDVIGINIKKKALYVCEVAVHTGGLRYTKNGVSDNVDRFIHKFSRNIPYAEKYFPDYEKHFMLWSPIVKSAGPNAQQNQLNDVNEIKFKLYEEYGYELKLIVNHAYQTALDELRSVAASQTKALQSPVLRLFQIEEKLKQHTNRMDL